MAVEAPRNLRDELQALRIDRGAPAATPPSRGSRGLWLGASALVVTVLLGLAA